MFLPKEMIVALEKLYQCIKNVKRLGRESNVHVNKPATFFYKVDDLFDVAHENNLFDIESAF